METFALVEPTSRLDMLKKSIDATTFLPQHDLKALERVRVTVLLDSDLLCLFGEAPIYTMRRNDEQCTIL